MLESLEEKLKQLNIRDTVKTNKMSEQEIKNLIDAADSYG